jgi:ribosome-associated protein
MAVPASTPTKKPSIEGGAAARQAVDVASDRQAEDIVLLDVRQVTPFVDYMVIMSAGSVRQLNALARELEDALEKAGLDLHHREGTATSGWVLIDFGGLVLHVFSQEQRSYYRLEQVWQSAKQLVRIQ